MSKILEEKKNDLITRAEEVLNTAKAEERELTDAEAQELAEIKDDVRRIKETLKLDEDFAEMATEKKADDEPEEVVVTEEMKQEQRAIDDVAMFDAYLRNRLNERVNNMTVSDNGAVIPETIANRIIAKVYDICPILERSDRYNVKGDLVLPKYDESVTAITVAYQSEFSAITSAVGKFTSVTLGGFLAGALSKVSLSLINNVEFNLVDYVVDRMAEAIARFIEGELLNGTDSKVAGLSGLTNSLTAGSASVITADEVIKLHDKVKDAHQSNAIWVMSPATRTALRLLKDSNGRYLLQDDISSPFGTSLLGKPVYVSDNMPEISTGNSVIFYGDMKGLATKFSENISIQVMREKYLDEHAIGVIGWFEFDAKVIDQQKIAKLVMA